MTRRAPAVTALGLLIALVGPLIYNLVVDRYVVTVAMGSDARALTGYTVMWILAAAVVAVTALGERRPLSSLGMARLTLRRFALAAGVGLALSLLVPLLSVAAEAVVSGDGGGVVDVATQTSVWVLTAGVVTAAVTEEVLFRGYAIERLAELTGRTWLGGLISLAAFVAIHVPNWSLAHLLGVVVPLGTVLTLLYLWRRNLPFVVVVHFMVNAPLVVLALAGQR